MMKTKGNGKTEIESDGLNINWIDMNNHSSKIIATPKEWPSNTDDMYGLKSELLDLCSPVKFMKPYDSVKVGKAIEIYGHLKETDANDIGKLSILRKDAESDLGIHINATAFYNHLMEVFSPAKYITEYNEELLHKYHQICTRLTENKDSIDSLEEILYAQLSSNNQENHENQESGSDFSPTTITVVVIFFLIFSAMLIAGYSL